MTCAYYNENDPFAAQWLRNLIAAGLIPRGHVDERDIRDVPPADLMGYAQHHFFAGIGGWPYALRLAGWPDDRPVWTGSCPCQPFSAAGNRKGADDERHLWPYWRWLIDQFRPSEIFGEQVASKDGRGWLSGVRADLERMGYGVGSADLCVSGAGAPHIRQRLYWVADADGGQSRHGELQPGRQHGQQPQDGSVVRLGHADDARSQGRGILSERPGERPSGPAGMDFWRDFDVILCTDGKARRIESGTFPLAHGVSGRVGLLRGYGNAIVPQVAAEFVQAYQEAEGVRA